MKQAQPLLENEFFEGSFLYQICISKTIKICQNQNTDPFRFPFTEYQKGPGTSFLATFFKEFFDKRFSFVILHNRWPNFITRLCLLPKVFSKMCFLFHAEAFDDVLTFEYLKS